MIARLWWRNKNSHQEGSNNEKQVTNNSQLRIFAQWGNERYFVFSRFRAFVITLLTL